ncbi:MAG: VWA domain-containing protein [Acidobacteriota bacterium]
MRAAWRQLAAGSFLIGLIAAPGLAFAASAPAGEPARDQTFTETTEVTAVEVPVQVVLDGKPVRGLTAANFVVYQDKQKEPVTGFEMVDLYAMPDDKAAEVPAPARRHFLLLFDLSFSEPKSVVKARDAAAGLLDELHASDLVAVATYTASRGPELVLGFTTDLDQARAAIATLGLPELIDRTPDPLKLVVGDLSGGLMLSRAPVGSVGRKEGGSGRPGAEARAAADEQRREELSNRMVDRLESFARESERANLEVQKDKVTALARSFTDLAKLMRSVDGRKYVVYLSEGYDSSILLGTTDKKEVDEDRRNMDSGDSWKVSSEERYGDSIAINEVDAMLQEFRRADCVIQAVDIGGLRAAAGGGGDLGVEHRGGRDSLFQMARDTGGDLYENFNDLSAAMGKMLERTGVTYVLTIQPQAAPDGMYHPLRVELKGGPRGARVVHRPGWFAPRPFAQRSRYEKMLATAGQVLAGEEGGVVHASMIAAPMPSAEEGQADVPLVVEVEGAGLLQGQQGADLPTEIYVYAMDAKGSVRDYIAQTLVLDLGKVEATLRQGGLKFYGHLELPPGSYKARLMVRNGRTGEYGLKVVPIVVPEMAQAGPVLLPPFFPEPQGPWLLTREAPRADRRDVPLPFRLGDRPFLPATTPTLDEGAETRFSMLGYNLREGDLQVRSEVQTADGRPAGPGDLTLTGRATDPAGAERLELTFRPAALKPGEYLLKVTVTDASGKAGTATTRFVVSGQPPGERS